MELNKSKNINNKEPLLSNEEITNRAVEKLEKEFSFLTKNGTGDDMVKSCIINVIAPQTKDTVQKFCKENVDFAIAVIESTNTFGDCLKTIADQITEKNKNAKQSKDFGISDIDVYRQVVIFYFPNISINMYISLTLPENYISKSISKETADLVWQQIQSNQEQIELKLAEKSEKEKKEKEEREKKWKEQRAKSVVSVQKNEEPKELQLSLF